MFDFIFSLRRPLPFATVVFFVGGLLNLAANVSWIPADLNLKEVMPHIAHVFIFSGYIGVAIFLVEEMLKRAVLCWADNHLSTFRASASAFNRKFDTLLSDFSDKFIKELTALKDDFIGALKNKEFRFEVSKAEYFKTQEPALDKDLLESAKRGFMGNADVREAFEEVMNGDNETGIIKLKALTAKDPEYKKLLLVALITSFDSARWTEAEPLLYEVGEPAHFGRLAFGYWKHRDTTKAVSLAEEGYKRAQNITNCDANVVGQLKNSLAYYYADLYLKTGQGEDKAELALRMVQEEVTRRHNETPTSSLYAEVLDTEGFVRIAYGKTYDEIEMGEKKCAEAYALGSTRELYNLHHSIAEKRLEDIKHRRDAQTTTLPPRQTVPAG